MRNRISKAVVAGLAALALGASLLATTEPAAAQQFHGGGWHGGGWHGGGGRYWHRGYWRGGTWYNGWWGPAVAAGVLLGAGAVAAYPYYGYGYDACWQNRPVYSPSGVYLGYQMVNVCQ